MPSKVLIIDDDITIRRTLKLLLKPEGYIVSTASNGEEGLDKAKQILPDLILLDVMMLDMSGFDVCQLLREDAILIDVPIILITGLDDRQARLKGAKVGADDFITKPFDPIQLLARIRTITRLNRYRRRLDEQEKFSWVVENSNNAYLMLDDNDCIQYANAMARLYLGLSAPDTRDLKNHYPKNLYFLEQVKQYYRCEPEEAWRHWEKRHASKKIDNKRYLVRAETADAKAFWLQVDNVRLPSGQTGLVRLHDITEEMQKSREQKRFQTLISHKLRTPLIDMSALQVLQRLLKKTDVDASIMELLDVALQNSSRLQKQILDILHYVEIANKKEVEKKSYDAGCDLMALIDIMNDIAEILEIHPPNIHLSHALADIKKGDMYLHLDAADVRCIFEKLLSNSQKFHPKLSPLIDINIQIEKNMLQFCVSDDGQHLAPDELHKLWQPYYQSEKYFTGEIAGMGLGLSTVAMLVWNVGGEYTLCNRKDKVGLSVSVSMPFYNNKPAS
jgi:CheY-like chemotaxis protein